METSNKSDYQKIMSNYDLIKSIIPHKTYNCSPMQPMKETYNVNIGKNQKFEYNTSKTFGLVKVFLFCNSNQKGYDIEYFQNSKVVKSIKYNQATISLTVSCENGFKFNINMPIKHAYHKPTQEEIEDFLRPAFKKELKRIRKNNITKRIDNLINSFRYEEDNYMNEVYTM